MSRAAAPERSVPLTKEQQELVIGALRLMEDIAGRFARQWANVLCLADIQAAARAALVEAAQNYDASQGAAFTTYATFRIEGGILRAIHRELRYRRPFIAVGAHRAVNDYLAEVSEMPEDHWDSNDPRWRRSSEAFSGGLAAAVVASVAADVLNSQDGSDEALERLQAHARLIDAIQTARRELPPRELALLDLHYGQEVALNEVAERINVSYATAKRVHASMLEQLAQKLRKQGIRSLADAGLTG